MNAPSKKISLFLLVMLIVSAIDSIRNLPSASIFGPELIFFFLFAAFFFLFPTSLISAELASSFPDKGGVYYWVTRAFGEKMGMLAIWLQWINTMVWYPTILAFIAGTASYLFNPILTENKFFLIIIILSVFWVLTFINFFGIEFSSRVNSFCGLIGTMLPMTLLIILGFTWLGSSRPLQISFTKETMLPSFSNVTEWVSLTAVMASFCGIELSGVHINDIKKPQRNFPIALGYSAFFLLSTMLLGSLAIAFVLPAENINLVSGVMQVFSHFFHAFNMGWAMPIITGLILIGSIGGVINWLISPAKGLLHSAQYGFLPKIFTKVNKYGVAYNILIAQAVLVSLFCLAFFLLPSVSSFYWFLTALSTDLYMLVYLLLFFSALRLRYKRNKKNLSYQIPWKNYGIWIATILGVIGCCSTIGISFFSPENFKISTLYYASLIGLGNLAMIAPVFLFYWYKKVKGVPIKNLDLDDSIEEPKSRPPSI